MSREQRAVACDGYIRASGSTQRHRPAQSQASTAKEQHSRGHVQGHLLPVRVRALKQEKEGKDNDKQARAARKRTFRGVDPFCLPPYRGLGARQANQAKSPDVSCARHDLRTLAIGKGLSMSPAPCVRAVCVNTENKPPPSHCQPTNAAAVKTIAVQERTSSPLLALLPTGLSFRLV